MKKRKKMFIVITSVISVMIVIALILFFIFKTPMTNYIPESEDHKTEEPVEYAGIHEPEKNIPEEPEIQETQQESEDHDESQPEDEPPELSTPAVEKIFNINESYTEMKERLDDAAAQYNCVAVSLVVYDGITRDYYTYQYGFKALNTRSPVDEDTKFRVASLAKLVAVICAMSLVEAGLLDLDVDISEYLGFSVRNPNFPDTIITSRMLIQHTSSIYDSGQYTNANDRNLPSTTKRLLDTGVCYEYWEPGTKFVYSNFGYSVLGLVCEYVSEKRFNTLSKEIIFEPLGIDAAFLPSSLIDKTNIAAIYDSTHTQRRTVNAQLDSGDSRDAGSDHNHIPGNLMISILDYTKILTMLVNGGTLDDIRIVSEDSVNEIHSTNVETEWYLQGFSTRYQNNEELPLESSFWHTGSAWGVFAQFNYFMGEGMNRGVVVITTGADTGRLENGMVEVCTDLSVLALQIFTDD